MKSLLKLFVLLFIFSCKIDNAIPEILVENDVITISGKKIPFENLKESLIVELNQLSEIPEKLTVTYNKNNSIDFNSEIKTEVQNAIHQVKNNRKIFSYVLPTLRYYKYKKEKGTDCGEVGDNRENCAIINFDYYTLEQGSEKLKETLNKWILDHLTYLLTLNKPDNLSLEQATKVYYKNHDSYKGSVIYGAFEATNKIEILSFNHDFITIKMTGNTYQGGAHGTEITKMATFDNSTGEQVTFDITINNKNDFKQLVEKKFREKRIDIFKNGFDFDTVFSFKLPENYAFVKEGILIHYNHYEITPYSLGTTSFLLPFNEIKHLLKKEENKNLNNINQTKKITKSIRTFYQWYGQFLNDEKRNIPFTKEVNNHLELDQHQLQQYFNNIKASGYISQQYVDNELIFLKNCEKHWKNESLDEPASCLDYDRFTCLQDDFNLLIDFYKNGTAEILSSTNNKTTVFFKHKDFSQKFDLIKENDIWKIAKIYCE